MKNLIYAYALMLVAVCCHSITQKEEEKGRSVMVSRDSIKATADTSAIIYHLTGYLNHESTVYEGITLTLSREARADDRYLLLKGRAHINRYSAVYIENPETGALRNMEFVSTRMAAADTTLMSAEQTFFDLLQNAREISVSGKEIRLRKDQHNGLLFSTE